jgi:hypothetical protein
MAPGGLAVVGKDIDGLYPAVLNSYAPRLGFAFAPERGGKWVIRGHYGIYYDIVNGNLFIDNRAGSDAGRGVSRNPGGPAPVFSISNPNLVVVQPNQLIFGSATPEPPFAVYTVSQNLRAPYVQNFGLDVQYQMTRNVLVQIGYVGNQGRKLVYTHNINQVRPAPDNTIPRQQRRPFFSQFPQFRGITEIETAANSSYHALQVSVRTSNWHRLSSQFSYTWGHAIDEQSFPRNHRLTNNYNRRFDRGNADFDYRHLFSAYVLYDVPEPANTLPWLTKGWQLNAYITADSGSPFTVFVGSPDVSNTLNRADRAIQVGNPYQGVTQPPTVQGRLVNGVRYFNSAAFGLPAAGTYGTVGRNSLYGPGFASVDFSVFKNFRIKERYQIQFRAEIFNLFNRLNLANPVSSVSSGNNGLIRGTRHGEDAPGIGYGEPFNVQFVLKFLF